MMVHNCIGQQPKEHTESQLPKTHSIRRSLTHRRISRRFSRTLRSTNLDNHDYDHDHDHDQDHDDDDIKEAPDTKITRSTSQPHMGPLSLSASKHHSSHHSGHETKPRLESIADGHEANTPKNLV